MEENLGLLNFEDDTLILILKALDERSLCLFGACNKTCYGISLSTEVWKYFFLKKKKNLPNQQWNFKRTWKESVLGQDIQFLDSSFASENLNTKEWASKLDFLPIQPVAILGASEAEPAGVPCLINDLMNDWPSSNWTLGSMVQQFPDNQFLLDLSTDETPNYFTLREYFEYSEKICSTGNDRDPIYLFDPAFETRGEGSQSLLSAYTVPKVFNDDLMSVIGDGRPAYRWLLVGAEGSGSTWHQDPNATSAWNSVVQGTKLWMFSPPDEIPPGVVINPANGLGTVSYSAMDSIDLVYRVMTGESECGACEPSEDEESPEHSTEINSGEETEESDEDEGVCGIPPQVPQKLQMCLQKPGQTIYIPSGWWHCTVNLSLTVAFTQNFISPTNLPLCYEYLSSNPEFNYLYSHFFDKLDSSMLLCAKANFERCRSAQEPGIFMFGPIYKCLTCNEKIGSEDFVACIGCSKVCHKDHKLAPVSYGRFYCDCQMGDLGRPCIAVGGIN